MVEMLRGYFISRGADAVTATREAYAALLTSLNVFQFFGVVFLLVLQFHLIMRRPARTAGPVAMH